MVSKSTILVDYIDTFKKLQKTHDTSKIALLYQVGDFFELYGVNNPSDGNVGNVPDICKVLDIVLSRKNKNSPEMSSEFITKECPYFAGFPKSNYEKHTKNLLDAQYVVTFVEQVTPPPNVKREITRTLSPGTFIDDMTYTPPHSSHKIISLFLSSHGGYGIASFDLSTGHIKVYEVSHNTSEVIKFIDSENPCEIHLFFMHSEPEPNCRCISTIREKFNIPVTQHDVIHQFNQIKFQNHFLGKIFPPNGFLTSLEILNLETKPNATISLLCGLYHIEQYDKSLICNLSLPVVVNDCEYMTLNENAMYQLDIIPQYVYQKNSLYKVMNKTLTNSGSRMLRHRLLNPITNKDVLNDLYDKIELFHKNEKIVDTIRSHLKHLPDVEKLLRKWIVHKVSPSEFKMVYNSCILIEDILNNEFTNVDIKDLFSTKYHAEQIFKLKQCTLDFRATFKIDILDKFHAFQNIDCNIFEPNKCKEVDDIEHKMHAIMNECLLNAKKLCTEPGSMDWVKLETPQHVTNGAHTWYYSVTKKRYEQLKKTSKDIHNYEVKTQGSTQVRLTSPHLLKNMTEYHKLKDKLQTKIIAELKKCMIDFAESYHSSIKKCMDIVIDIDATQCLAKISSEYGYVRPEMCDSIAFIEAQNLRHPIIERLDQSTSYVSQSISLNDSEFGMLLYGLNGGGKSSLMKSVGLSIVMAQMGCYVPAHTFKFSPFYSLFTRISGDDNIYKGHSSFQVEMMELKNILANSNDHSLVLGDEICKGTEHNSALSIVGASLKKMCCTTKPRFIFATHLHELCDLSIIRNLPCMGIYHLSVEMKDGEIIYNRNLKQGSGPSSYGLEVAEYIIQDQGVILDAHSIRQELLTSDSDNDSVFGSSVSDIKCSSYNSNVIVDECYICKHSGENLTKHNEILDVHHIEYQENANKYGIIKSEHNNVIHKNIQSNLVTLCQCHHDQIHNGKIKINSYYKSSQGVRLDYKINDSEENQQQRSKYTHEQMQIIESYKNIKNIPLKQILLKLKTEHDISISSTTIRKYWKSK